MKLSSGEWLFLILIITVVVVIIVCVRDLEANAPSKIVYRHCGIAFLICLAAATGLLANLFYFAPQVLAPPAIPSAVPEPEHEPDVSQLVELPITDYAEILRHSEEYDGQVVRVAGRIAQLGYATNRRKLYFRDRLGFLGIGKSFEIALSQYFHYDEGVSDYYTVNQYVLVQGVWSHSKRFPALIDATVISTGEEAQQANQVFMDEWVSVGMSYAEFPITDYMDLFAAPKHYLGQRVRTVGQIRTVGTNAIAGDKYFYFSNRNNNIRTDAFSLQGCPPEMQEVCVEGEYIVLSCLVSEGDYGSIEFLDCFVECVGTEAEALSKQADAEWWERFAAARDEYIASCNTYSYEELARYPGEYKDNRILLSGTVIQPRLNQYDYPMLLDVGQGNIVYVIYRSKLPGDPEILEGDQITFYGVFNGTGSYDIAPNETKSAPKVVAQYSSFNQLNQP